MINKTIMIIGAGFSQLLGIKTAKRKGLTVIAIDRNPNAPGMKLADFALPVDITDINGAIEVAKSHDIDGVLTQTDLGVPTVGAIVDVMELPGVGSEAAYVSTNKVAMKERFKEFNVPSPAFEGVKTVNEAYEAVERIGFPIMIKAVDNAGSRGVTRLDSFDGLKDAFENSFMYSRDKQVCVEKYVEGIKFGAEAFTYKGKSELVLIHNCTVTPPPHYLNVGHSFPSKLPKGTIKKAEGVISKALKALSIDYGPSNIDLILTEKGPQILEIAARMGTTCLPELVYEHTGINWVEQSIKIALGDKPSLKPRCNKACAALLLGAEKEGKIKEIIVPDEIGDISGVVDVSIDVKIGDEVKPFAYEGANRIGQLIATDETAELAEKKAERIKRMIRIGTRGH
jgi:biotin carboxylase